MRGDSNSLKHKNILCCASPNPNLRSLARSTLVRDNQLRHALDHLHGLALRLVEAGLAHSLDDLGRAEAQAVGVHRDVLEAPQGAERGPVQGVVHHEVVHQETSARLQRLHGIGVQVGDDGLGHGARDVGHQHDIEGLVGNGPLRARRVEMHELHPVLNVLRLLGLDLLAGAADLGQLQDGGLQARSRAREDVREGAGTTADIQHRRDASQLQLLLDKVLRGGHGAVVLSLRVGLRHLGV
mmetsp:Transcript_11618/g.41459  ORF Transcript_11618/g.41459 Transcript_11618/m.41459 type:complete len:240 (+) Transcript_11618:128-847(+)